MPDLTNQIWSFYHKMCIIRCWIIPKMIFLQVLHFYDVFLYFFFLRYAILENLLSPKVVVKFCWNIAVFAMFATEPSNFVPHLPHFVHHNLEDSLSPASLCMFPGCTLIPPSRHHEGDLLQARQWQVEYENIVAKECTGNAIWASTS